MLHSGFKQLKPLMLLRLFTTKSLLDLKASDLTFIKSWDHLKLLLQQLDLLRLDYWLIEIEFF